MFASLLRLTSLEISFVRSINAFKQHENVKVCFDCAMELKVDNKIYEIVLNCS